MSKTSSFRVITPSNIIFVDQKHKNKQKFNVAHPKLIQIFSKFF